MGVDTSFRAFNLWINSFLFAQPFVDAMVDAWGIEGGYYLVCYLRDLLAGSCLYWVSAGLVHRYIYHWKVDKLFLQKGRTLPTLAVIQNQMLLAQASLFVYALLPVISEFFIEQSYTLVFYHINEVGWLMYILYLFLYVIFVEVGIYWVHRTLHTNKFLYKWVHSLHHKYNKVEMLTPWCSIAFNPLDGVAQASPYIIGLFFVPVHYFTFLFLFFFTAIWATNIHDAVPADTEPIMGSKYHTIHHTHYHCNFGQFFTLCDAFWGTLRTQDHLKRRGKIT